MCSMQNADKFLLAVERYGANTKPIHRFYKTKKLFEYIAQINRNLPSLNENKATTYKSKMHAN